MTANPSTPSPTRRLRGPRWLASRRRRVVAGVAVVLVAAVIVLGIMNPFATTAAHQGVTDNSYPTGTQKVTEQSLSSQTSVSATLGFAGSYAVNLPNGTSAGALGAAESTAQVAEAQVASARIALAKAKATARPTNASTLLAARGTVTSDGAALAQAEAQLAADENLSCPASSSATVTSPVGGAGASASTPNGNSSTSSDSPSIAHDLSENVDAGIPMSGASSNGPQPLTPSMTNAPTVTTGAVNDATSTGATLTGSVNPNGAQTTYYFEYGTSPNYGATTVPSDVGSGSDSVSVTYALADLIPGDSYHYRLVATNLDGSSYGEDATFQTSAAPSVSTGTATPISSTSESLAGTINPNGVDTTYYFEYGTSASFGETSPVIDGGGGQSPVSVTITIANLTAGATYDYALVASSALGTVVGATSTFQPASSSCVAEHGVMTADSLALSQARYALTLDELGQGAQVDGAEATLVADERTGAIAEQAISADEANAINANTTFTELPRLGAVIDRGGSVYRLNEQPVPLFYGPVPLYRALYLGVSSGPDVTELNRNLIALGFERGVASDVFTGETESAVEAWQASLGETANGVIALGDVVIEPGPLEVASVSAALGAQANGGMAVLTATSKTPVVTIALDASQQSEVKVGDPVTITLPNNANTPGVVSSVGAVAINPPSSFSGSDSGTGPTITVIVIPTKLSGIGHYDQAPVNVSITNGTVTNALTVPVDALLALENGGYAVEEVSPDGAHHLVGVTLGLFDDATGRAQVSGSGLAAGQRVVVPNL
jgi:hypothetical protein